MSIKFSKNESKGITLIALVITIIVLLILAGVTINTLLGNESILKKASEAKEEDAHGKVRDQIQLELANYELEKGTEKTNKTSIQYLAEKGYFNEEYSEETESYTIKSDKISNVSTGKGTSKETGDVYVIEKQNVTTGSTEKLESIGKLASVQESDVTSKIKVAEETTKSDNWTLRYYYKANENKEAEELLTFTSKGNITGEYGEKIETVGELIASNKIKIGDYVDYEKLIGKQRSFNTWDCDYYGNEIGIKTLKTENLKWRVLSIDEENGNLTLISEKPTYATFETYGNDEEVLQKLNEACNTLYGTNGIECRNLDYSDILNGYEDDENIKDIIIGKNLSSNDVYYEGAGDGKYYAMLVTDVEKKRLNSKVGSIYQNRGDLPELYNSDCHWHDVDEHRDTEYCYFPMRPVVILNKDTKLTNILLSSVDDIMNTLKNMSRKVVS